MTLLLASLFATASLAADPPASEEASGSEEVEVLAAPFQARDNEVIGVASLLHGFLEQQLDARSELVVVPVDQAGVVFDQRADLYLASCPPGEEIGCAIVVAEAAGVPYAVTGYVELVDGKPHIHVWVLDIGRMRQAEFERDLEEGQDDLLVSEAAETVMAVVRDRAGQPVDERFRTHKSTEQLEEEQRREEEKQALARDKNDPGRLESDRDIELERDKYTEADLAERMEVEGGKPWDRLDMTPRQYLRYQNSGLNLIEWRKRAAGRQSQLVLRPGLGLLRAPTAEDYYGRWVYDPDTLAILQRYAWQGVSTASAVTGMLTVSYGVLPLLEVGLNGGYASGHYDVDVTTVKAGEAVRDHDPTRYASGGLFGGPQVLTALLPTSSVRPVLGGAFLVWSGTQLDDHVAAFEELETFPSTLVGIVEVRAGAELRLGSRLDAYIHVPFQAVVFGGDPQVQDDGAEYLTGSREPTSPDAFSAGLLLGFQVKLLGPKAEARTLEDYEE